MYLHLFSFYSCCQGYNMTPLQTTWIYCPCTKCLADFFSSFLPFIQIFSHLYRSYLSTRTTKQRYIEIWYVFLGNLPTLLALRGTINWFWKGGVGLAVFMTDSPGLGENMLTRSATCYCLVTATARKNINLTPRRIERRDRSNHSFQYPLIPSNPLPPTSLSSLPLAL